MPACLAFYAQMADLGPVHSARATRSPPAHTVSVGLRARPLCPYVPIAAIFVCLFGLDHTRYLHTLEFRVGLGRYSRTSCGLFSAVYCHLFIPVSWPGNPAWALSIRAYSSRLFGSSFFLFFVPFVVSSRLPVFPPLPEVVIPLGGGMVASGAVAHCGRYLGTTLTGIQPHAPAGRELPSHLCRHGRARAFAGAARVGAYTAPSRGRLFASRTSARSHIALAGTALPSSCLWSTFPRLCPRMSVYIFVGSNLCGFAPTQVSVAAQLFRYCQYGTRPVSWPDRGFLRGLACVQILRGSYSYSYVYIRDIPPLTVPRVLLCPAPYPRTPRARRGLHPCAPSVPFRARLPLLTLPYSIDHAPPGTRPWSSTEQRFIVPALCLPSRKGPPGFSYQLLFIQQQRKPFGSAVINMLRATGIKPLPATKTTSPPAVSSLPALTPSDYLLSYPARTRTLLPCAYPYSLTRHIPILSLPGAYPYSLTRARTRTLLPGVYPYSLYPARTRTLLPGAYPPVLSYLVVPDAPCAAGHTCRGINIPAHSYCTRPTRPGTEDFFLTYLPPNGVRIVTLGSSAIRARGPLSRTGAA
ncbi:hypothetical protein B0H16DRAFT_1893771 [Mycena metata]|uniref:Uncharacterized protein n=1 Tax=Mycena metata TaxID=1033252 RepID=A0AAD7HWH0_9AGAR|nr:hypothetical protein B0H16DRAFT_1893771 [Mycena metata]